MKIVLMQCGKTRDELVEQLSVQYFNRLRHYINFELLTLPDLKNTKSLNEAQVKEREGEMILKNTEKSDFIILLDEKGKEFSSVQFAGHLQKIMNQGLHRICFVIGGPYGFAAPVYERANQKISLSRMTFSHQIIRAIFAEQIYRAFTILNNEPYHHQ